LRTKKLLLTHRVSAQNILQFAHTANCIESEHVPSESMSAPEKLRDEVAAAVQSDARVLVTLAPVSGDVKAEAVASDGDSSIPATLQPATVSNMVHHMMLQLQVAVKSEEGWSSLRDACDPSAAVDLYLQEKVAQLARQGSSCYDDNAKVCHLLEQSIAHCKEVSSWPEGIDALEAKQGLNSGVSGLINTDIPTFQSSPGLFGPSEIHGVSALVWMQQGIVTIDMGTSTLRPAEAVSLARALPARIQALCLDDTDFAQQGKDLSGLAAICALFARPTCSLTTLQIARNRLPSEAGYMVVDALGSDACRLTTLDATGNEISGEAARELAKAVLASDCMTEFGGIILGDLRNDEITGELDFKTKGFCGAEGRVLSALLPHAKQLESVVVDGAPLPLRELSAKPANNREDEGVGDDSEEMADLQLLKSTISVASAAILGASLASNAPLATLNLNYNKLGTEGTWLLAEGLKRNMTLTSLGVSWNRIGVEGLIHLADMLQENTTLASLELSSNEICGVNSFGQGKFSAEGMDKLARSLGKCGIRTLDLSNNCLAGLNGRSMGTFCNEGIARLADGLPESSVLSLILDGNQLGSLGTITLAAGLEAVDSLRLLSLADCYATDAGADLTGLSRLVTAFRNLHDLSVVNLDGNAVGLDGVLLLVPWLREAKMSLSALHIERSSNRLTDAAEEELKSAIGQDVLLHLERGAASYQAAMNKAASLQMKSPRPVRSPALTPSQHDALSGGLSLSPQPPRQGAGPGNPSPSAKRFSKAR
jgi:Ran GTPase-activating protein (RanGAP) involved in mRNA processing and transport